MGSNLKLKEAYDRIAEDWHQDHKTDDWWIKGTDKFISFLKKGDLVLDVGCGGGMKSKYLLNKGLKVVGIDFSSKMIEISKQEVLMGKFFVLDLNEINKLKYLFDGIFMQAVLLHIPKNEVTEKFKIAMEKLKKGGYLYVAVKEKKSEGSEEEVRVENDYGYSYERFFSYFTISEMESYFREVGLEIVSIDVNLFGKTNWIQIIGRK